MIYYLAHINKHVKKKVRERCMVLKPNHTCTYGTWDTDTHIAVLIKLYTSVLRCVKDWVKNGPLLRYAKKKY